LDANIEEHRGKKKKKKMVVNTRLQFFSVHAPQVHGGDAKTK
jgi:hypothetical protein